MIHINEAANKEATRLFFDKFNRHLIPHDVIGQSYYPWWHGSLLDLRDNLAFMSETYRRDIILDVADNCRQGEYLDKPGHFQNHPKGQRMFMDEARALVMGRPNGRGQGVFWWEPAVTGGLGAAWAV